MEWMTTIARTLDLIEENLLSEELTLAGISKEVNLSESHLQRAFGILTGMSIADYIRRRRLTLAAQELATSDQRVIDLAYKYLYDTPEAFNKAFRRQHGLSPIEARKPGVTLNACTRLTIEIKVKGAPSMNYKLIEKEGFSLVGKTITTTIEDGVNLKEIPQFWQESNQNGLVESITKTEGMTALAGACMMEDPTGKTFEYGICAIVEGLESEVNKKEGQFEVYPVQPATWAVFECVGAMPTAIQSLFQQIYSEWFPSTGYAHAPGPEIEVYLPGDVTSPDYYCEIWIPILKK